MSCNTPPTPSPEDWRSVISQQLMHRNSIERNCCGTLTHTYGVLLKRHNALRDAHTTALSDLEKERDQVARLHADLNSMEQRYAPSKQNSRIAELEATNKSLQQQLQRAFDGSQRLIQVQEEARDLKHKVENLETALSEMTCKADSYHQQNTALASDVAALRKTEETLRTELEATSSKLDVVSKDNGLLTNAAIATKTQLADTMNTNVELESHVIRLQREIEDLRRGGGGGGGFSRSVENDSLAEGMNSSYCFSQQHQAMGFFDESVTRRGAYASVPTGRKVRDIDGAHDSEINCCVFAGDFNRVVTGGNDKYIRLWDVSSGELATSFTTTGSVLAMSYVNDILIAACGDSVTRVFTVSTQRSRCQLTGHTDSVTAVAATVDGKHAYTGSKDRTLKQWDIKERGSFVWTRPCYSLCHDISVSNDSVITAHFDAVLRIWDSRQGTVTSEVKNAHSAAVTSVDCSCDPHKFATLSRDNTIKLWDSRRYEAYATLTHPDLTIPSNFCRVRWSGCGSYVVVGGTNNVLVFGGQKVAPPVAVLKNGHRGVINCVAWSPDGKYVCSVGHDKKMILWA